ncbi:MAG TPA: hypothetical protein VJ550_09985 [Geomonas sp.]|nr:hypothetical protein [Geomonas sp.]
MGLIVYWLSSISQAGYRASEQRSSSLGLQVSDRVHGKSGKAKGDRTAASV